MTTNWFTHPGSLILATSLLLGWTAAAEDLGKVDYARQLSIVKPAELPEAAAQIVANTPDTQRPATAAAVVHAVAGIRMAALVPTVGAVAKAAPNAAPAAAAAAAELLPKRAVQIAKAAATGAPDQAGAIVLMVCRNVPARYQDIAAAVAKIVPARSNEILAAVGTAIPALQPYLTAASRGTSDVSVLVALNQAVAAAQSDGLARAEVAMAGGSAARGPTVGPPYIPLSTTPGNANPDGSVDVPEGGREYSSP